MKIIEISDHHDLKRFAACGVEMSRSHPDRFRKNYSSQLALWDPTKNFFFSQGGKAWGWLAMDKGKTLGRIAAMTHPYVLENSAHTGLIGLFECVDNKDIARDLLAVACDRLRSMGCEKATGPIDFSIWHEYRFMTKGFGSYNLIGEPRNPLFYPEYWEHFGFTPDTHWTTFLYNRDALNPLPESMQKHEINSDRLGYGYKPMSLVPDKQLMQEVYHLLMPSYRTFPLYTPLTEVEFLTHHHQMPSLINKNNSFLLQNPCNQTVGFGVQYKDLNPAITAMRGGDGLVAKTRFLMKRKAGRVAIIAQGGTLTEYSREALQLGREALGEPFSLGQAGTARLLRNALNTRQYDQFAIALVRDQALHRKHMPQNTVETREYNLYQFKL